MAGPLHGVRVLEIGGIGPGPFAGMMLADHGADVIRIERPGVPPIDGPAVLRSRRSFDLDLKAPGGRDIVRTLAQDADVLIEGARPGVMERLGLGPADLIALNPRLVYARMTGWGQEGPLSQAPGHDINYIATTGALHAIGGPERPAIPVNLVGDYGGGAMLLAFGIMTALWHARESGQGQVIDASIVDGTALLMAPMFSRLAQGAWRESRESNVLDGGAPFYNVYRCADGGFVAVGAIEPQFYRAFLERLNLTEDPVFKAQRDRAYWPAGRRRLETIFGGRSRDEWCVLFEGSEACVAPVLSMTEAMHYPHNSVRDAFTEVASMKQPAPAPRFSVTPLANPRPWAPADTATPRW